MEYAKVFGILEELNLIQYKDPIKEHYLTDEILLELVNFGLLVDNLKEVIPPLGHRLAVLAKLNRINGTTVTLAPPVDCNSEELSQGLPDNSEKQVNCTHCSSSIEICWKKIWSHLRYHHFMTQTKILWTCPFCHSHILRFRSFKTHVLKHISHSVAAVNKLANASVSRRSEGVQPEKVSSNANENNLIFNYTEKDNVSVIEDKMASIKEKAVKFVVRLKSNGKLPITIADDILSTVTKLVGDIIDVSASIALETKEVQAILFTQLKNPFLIVSSHYLLEKHLKHLDLLISPEEVVLDSHLKTKKGKLELVFDTFQYVPIEKIFLKVLNMPGVMKSVIQTNENIQEKVYNSSVCGKYLRSKLEKCDVPVVFVLFYYDEVEVCNALGPRHGTHKLGNCYFSILNIHPSYLSKLENIFLCCSFKAELLHRYPMSRILQKAIQALTSLSKINLLINTDAYTGEVKVCLGQVCGDNLGLHQLFRFSESFVANYPCRFCTSPRYRCLTAGREIPLLRRNKFNYTCDLNLQDLSKTGIKNDSVFNELPEFHITENYCPDIMHDIFEGVAPLNMKLLLNYLLCTDVVTLSEINSRIWSYDFQHLQKDKPSILSARNLANADTLFGQTAGQTNCLLQCFAFMFGDKFRINDKYWELFLIFSDIMDILMSPCVSDSSISLLQFLIEDHHATYQILAKKSLRPKHHHMVHYPEAIRQIGPLIHYWTIRFEARHKFFKHIAKIGSNFKNIAKTVSRRNQLLLSYKFLENKPFLQYNLCTSELTPASAVDLEHLYVIQRSLNINDTRGLSTCKHMTLDGTKVKPNDILLKSWMEDNELPSFAKVLLLLCLDDKYHVFTQKLKTLQFVRHYHAYELEVLVGDYSMCETTEFDLFKPMISRRFESKLLVRVPYVCS